MARRRRAATGQERLVHAAQWFRRGIVQALALILAGFDILMRPLSEPLKRMLRTWAAWHWQVITSTIGQLREAPFTTMMTASVIGIALALPAGLYVLLENVQDISQGWSDTAQISLFLKLDKTDEEAKAIAGELREYPALEQVEVITRAEALAEYRQLSGFQTLFDALAVDNPLPAVLVLYPAPDYSDLAAIERIVNELKARDEVEIAQFDMQWLKRLYTIMELTQRIILGLSALLALGVLLIVGNTIRLGIRNRREEIEITKLFGASNAFIRRPFLYTGLWYGLLGGIIAWILVGLFFALLHGPVNRLSVLYHTEFPPIFPGVDVLLILLCAGAALGLSGSWIAVGRQLSGMEPS
uniref:Cell division protein FtsX n=1 Tax=Candidatus Kentrum sp. DK TaxID=2126562 RepID=A0A450SVE1_9GAMM|nr:MAG: cell division protein FtsX [Candidatus Kentron sp. DK]VFJ57929.1 MAG: cell division protein FtsX [Candidatus Kentron sp. DK]